MCWWPIRDRYVPLETYVAQMWSKRAHIRDHHVLWWQACLLHACVGDLFVTNMCSLALLLHTCVRLLHFCCTHVQVFCCTHLCLGDQPQDVLVTNDSCSVCMTCRHCMSHWSPKRLGVGHQDINVYSKTHCMTGDKCLMQCLYDIHSQRQCLYDIHSQRRHCMSHAVPVWHTHTTTSWWPMTYMPVAFVQHIHIICNTCISQSSQLYKLPNFHTSLRRSPWF